MYIIRNVMSVLYMVVFVGLNFFYIFVKFIVFRGIINVEEKVVFEYWYIVFFFVLIFKIFKMR